MNSYFMGRLGNGLYKNAGIKYVSYPYDARFDFGIQNNWTASFIINQPAQTTLRLGGRLGGTSQVGAGLQLDLTSDGNAYFLYRDDIAGGTIRQGIICTLPSGFVMANRIITVDFVKSNANPTVSVSATEWKIYFNGVACTINTSFNTLTPSSVITLNAPYFCGRSIGGSDSIQTMMSFQLFNTALSQAEITTKYVSEGTRIPQNNLVINETFRRKNGKTGYNSANNGIDGTLVNFTDAETANAGQPQSGNLVWVNAYTLQPITS